MTKIIDLPMEIFYYGMLPFFRWNDLLRFRRVCSTLKGYTDAFIIGGRRLSPFEIHISDEQPVSDVLHIHFPIRRIYFNTSPSESGAKLFENCSQVSSFLEKFGPTITHVRFHNLSVHLFLNENRQFLEGLSNLESLEFETVGPSTGVDGNKALTLDQIGTLQKLKCLKIEASLPVGCIYDLMLITSLKRQCGTQIQYLSLPRIATFWERNTGDLLFQSVQLETLKYFDFGTFSEKGPYGNVCLDAHIRWPQFPEICNALVAANVKLLNVPADLFENYYLLNNNPDVWEVESQEQVAKAILSLLNLHLAVNDLEMPNLEKITITSARRTSIFSRYDAAKRPRWPRLRLLDITIDSKRLAPTGLFPAATITYTQALLHFLFVGICRPSVDQLCLRFTNAEGLPVPKSDHLISALPNLKTLVLVNWQGSNRSLAQLWAGFPLLEQVYLERCTCLGNAAFFGEDIQNPVFLKLKKLTSLSLKGLEHMPYISDTLFRLIIRHLNLKHLTLEGGHENPLKNITVSGIRSLLFGPFAQSIERFSLGEVRLEYVGKEEMRRLETMFRSYNML